MKKTSLLLLTLVTFCTSCSFERDEIDFTSLILETDREQYDTSQMIQVTARNVSDSTIYFSRCMPTTLEWLDGENVIGVLGFPACECVCVDDIHPNQSWSYEVNLNWIDVIGAEIEPGLEYRLQLAFFRDLQLTNLIEAEDLYTNRFSVTVIEL